MEKMSKSRITPLNKKRLGYHCIHHILFQIVDIFLLKKWPIQFYIRYH